tara:strand:- start:4 stop:1191 length:1188 start_codon:yes stop_codon:yes gene_type:complete
MINTITDDQGNQYELKQISNDTLFGLELIEVVTPPPPTGDTITFISGGDPHNEGNPNNPNELSEGLLILDALDWDFGLMAGDEVVAWQRSLSDFQRARGQYETGLPVHGAESLYHCRGNHDPRPIWGQVFAPTGENENYNNKPYQTVGDYDGYYFDVGQNLRIVVMCDFTAGLSPGGEDDLPFNPPASTRASGHQKLAKLDRFEGWVEDGIAQDKIIVILQHQGTKDTIAGTEEWGHKKLVQQTETPNYGANNLEDERRRGYTGLIQNEETGLDNIPMPGDSDQTRRIKDWYNLHGDKIALVISGHTHPEFLGAEWNGKGLFETAYGTHFVNTCPLNTYVGVNHLNVMKALRHTITGNQLKIETIVLKDPHGTYADGEVVESLTKTIILHTNFIL